MDNQYYCIYTNEYIEKDKANIEHIIPLSLGGSDQFTIYVNKEFNSKVGSSIDGQLANEFFTMLRRKHFGAKGHSNKEPIPLLKKSFLSINDNEDKPIQVKFSKDKIQLYDPVEKRYLTDQEKAQKKIKSIVTVDRDNRINFTAKVALAAGYFVYGDLFVNNVTCDELRFLMNFNKNSKEEQKKLKSIKTKAVLEFFNIEEKDKNTTEMYEYIAKYIQGSFVLFVPGPINIGIVVGTLGKLTGVLNCPANTDNFPLFDEHDLGHIVIIENGKVTRKSFRSICFDVYTHMQNEKNIQ